MVRSALAGHRNRLTRGPRPAALAIPAISVLLASLTAALPVVSTSGWWPDAGLLMLLGWRLLRADAWPAWAAAGLGLFNDLVTGSPIGLSVALWPLFMLAMDIVDRRTMWRDYWIEWMVASLFIAFAEMAQWRAAASEGAALPFSAIGPSILVAIFCFPIAAALVSRLDRWRLRR